MDTKPDLTNNNNNNNKRITPLETDPKSNLKLEAENKINKKQQTKNSKQQQQQQEQKQPKTKKEQWQTHFSHSITIRQSSRDITLVIKV